METTVERLTGSRVRITLSFGAEEIDTAFDKAYRTLGKQVSIRGFRPGKAPRVLLERHLGKEVAPSQVMQDLVPDALEKAVEEQEISAIGEPELDAEPPTIGEPYTVSAVFTVWPVPEIGDWSGESVVRPKVTIDEETITEGVESLRAANAASEEITDRGVEKGDFVRASYQITCDGEELYGADQLPQLFLEVGAEWYTPAIDGDIIGMTIGETKDIEVTYAEDYEFARLAGRTATFRATIDAIQVRNLPELDEAFFTTAGVADLDALRQRIIDERTQELAPLLERAAQDQALLAVVKNTKIALPEAVIATQVNERWEGLERDLDEKGVTLDEYLEEEGHSREELTVIFRKRAKRALATALVVEELAKAESIEVPEEEIEEAVWRLAQSAKTGFSEMLELLERTGQLEEMKRVRLTDRVADWLLERLTIEEPEMTFAAAAAGEWVPDLDLADLEIEEEGEAEPQAETAEGTEPEAAETEPAVETEETEPAVETEETEPTVETEGPAPAQQVEEPKEDDA